MNKKYLVSVFLIVLLVASFAGCTSTENGDGEIAEFEVTGLDVSSSEVSPGDSVTVSVDVENTGGEEGTKTVEFTIDGETVTEDVTLGAGESDSVSVSVSKDSTGTYEVSASDMSETFDVVETGTGEASFEVSNLDLSSTGVNPGDSVTVSVDVENTGEEEGTKTVEFTIDGQIVTKDVTLGAGESDTISTTVTKDSTGTYDVSVEDLSQSFEVSETAPEPIILSGNGDTSTETFTLEEGIAIFYFTHNGDSNFIVELLNAETGETVLGDFPNVIGSFEGSTALGVTGETMYASPGEHLLNIDADGDWEVRIEQPRPSDAPTPPQTFSEEGWKVTEPFKLEEGTATFEFTHDGSSNFIVQLYDEEGNRIDTLVNEIGEYEGSTTVGVTGDMLDASPGIHYLSVDADGNWEININQ